MALWGYSLFIIHCSLFKQSHMNQTPSKLKPGDRQRNHTTSMKACIIDSDNHSIKSSTLARRVLVHSAAAVIASGGLAACCLQTHGGENQTTREAWSSWCM